MQRLLYRIQRFQGLADRRGASTAVGVGVAQWSAARCPRMRMRMQWEEPCCKTGPRPAKTRGWQPAAGLRAHGTNQLHPFFCCERNGTAARATANRRGIPSSGQQCLSVPVPVCAWPDLSEEMMMMTVDHQHASQASNQTRFFSCLQVMYPTSTHSLQAPCAQLRRCRATRAEDPTGCRGAVSGRRQLDEHGDAFGGRWRLFRGSTQTPEIRHGHLEYELEGDNRPAFGLPESHFIFG